MDDKNKMMCDLETGICSTDSKETTSFIDLSSLKEDKVGNDDLPTEKLIIL